MRPTGPALLISALLLSPILAHAQSDMNQGGGSGSASTTTATVCLRVSSSDGTSGGDLIAGPCVNDRVGIGNNAPTQPLEVKGSTAIPASTFAANIYSTWTISSQGNSATGFGVYSYVNQGNTTDNSGNTAHSSGGEFILNETATGVKQTGYGLIGRANVIGTNLGTGVNKYGSFSKVFGAYPPGTIGTKDVLIGSYSGVCVSQDTNCSSPAVSTATVIALYVDANTGGAIKYGIFQAGTSDTNYLGGNTGVNTASPAFTLDVNGSFHANSAAVGNNTLPADANVISSGTLGIFSTTTAAGMPLFYVKDINSSELFRVEEDGFTKITGTMSFATAGTGINWQDGSKSTSANGPVNIPGLVVSPSSWTIGTNIGISTVGYGAGVQANFGNCVNTSAYYTAAFGQSGCSAAPNQGNGNIGDRSLIPVRFYNTTTVSLVGMDSGDATEVGIGADSGGAWLGSGKNNTVRFNLNGSEKFRLDTNGSVDFFRQGNAPTGTKFEIYTATQTVAVSTNGYVDFAAGPISTTTQLSGCGTGATFRAGSNNQRGEIQMGTTPGNTCTVTFNLPNFAVKPFCVVSGQETGSGVFLALGTINAATFTVTCDNTSGLANCGAGTIFDYICLGN